LYELESLISEQKLVQRMHRHTSEGLSIVAAVLHEHWLQKHSK